MGRVGLGTVVLRPEKVTGFGFQSEFHSKARSRRPLPRFSILTGENWQPSLSKKRDRRKSNHEWYWADQKPKHGPIRFSGGHGSDQEERPGKTKDAHVLAHPIVPVWILPVPLANSAFLHSRIRRTERRIQDREGNCPLQFLDDGLGKLFGGRRAAQVAGPDIIVVQSRTDRLAK